MISNKNLMAFVFIYLWSSVSTYGSTEKLIVDDLGKKFFSDTTPQRFVSLAPSNTELLVALGLESRIVGRTRYCNFPKSIDSVEVVAGFNTLDLEKIAALNPDVVFAIRGNDMESLRGLDRLGIPFFSFDIKNLNDLSKAIKKLGIFLDVESRADSLVTKHSIRIKNVRQKVLSINERPKVMWGLGDNSFYTAGKSTMIDNVIDLAGGDNVAREARGEWPQVSIETVLIWSPDIIITTQGDAEGLPALIERLSRTRVWENIPAVMNKNILFIQPDLLLRPGPRLIDALEIIADFIVSFHSNR